MILTIYFCTQIRAERNGLYSWRNIPRPQSCSVLATPLRPRNISNVSVSGVAFDRVNQTLSMSVEVIPSSKMHGTLGGYVFSLRRSATDCYECEGSNTWIFQVFAQWPSGLSPAMQNAFSESELSCKHSCHSAS